MGGWTPMKRTDALLGAQGATARNWFIHTPVCCPSRAEILTGRYLHNVRTSDGSGCMHVNESKVNPVSYAHYLNAGANYSVGYFGKHLNNCPSSPPPGFDCPTCYWFAYVIMKEKRVISFRPWRVFFS